MVFDLDGLLVDSEPLQAIAFNEVLARFDINLGEEQFEELVGYETAENFRLLRSRFAIPLEVPELLRLKEVSYHRLVRARLQCRPGASELTLALHVDRVPLAIASSSPAVDVHLSLEAVGLRHCFSPVVTAADVARTKPAPDLYLAACRGLGLPPERCLAFEDSGAGLTAAVAAGLTCIAVPNRYTASHDFSRAVAVLNSLEGLTVQRLERLLPHSV